MLTLPPVCLCQVSSENDRLIGKNKLLIEQLDTAQSLMDTERREKDALTVRLKAAEEEGAQLSTTLKEVGCELKHFSPVTSNNHVSPRSVVSYATSVV